MLSFRLDSSQSLLCRAIADMDPEERAQAACDLLAALGDARTFDFAQRNQVASVVAHVLMDSANGGLSPRWRAIHDGTHARISAYLIELDRVATRLADEGIALVALKNGGIARGVYPCLGCCPMGDLDVLVEKRHFRRAHQILLDEEYRFEFRSPLEEAELEAAEKDGSAEYYKVLPNGEKLWFELQWRPVAGRWIRSDQEPSAEELIARSVAIAGTAVRLLLPEDNLLQVALHTAKHSYVRAPGFRLHLDVDRIVRRQSIDWHLFLTRIARLQVKTAVYFSLAIPRALFQTPIPEEVLARLQPSAWKVWLIQRWLARVGLFDPDEPKFGRLGYIFFTALLYDDWRGLWRGIFPSRAWMRERYGFQNEWLLPYYHARRLMDLAFRRVVV